MICIHFLLVGVASTTLVLVGECWCLGCVVVWVFVGSGVWILELWTESVLCLKKCRPFYGKQGSVLQLTENIYGWPSFPSLTKYWKMLKNVLQKTFYVETKLMSARDIGLGKMIEAWFWNELKCYLFLIFLPFWILLGSENDVVRELEL